MRNAFKSQSWISSLMKSNFKRRFKRNLISIISLVIGLVSSMLIIGFSFGGKTSVNEKSYHQLNYGVASLYKETKQTIPGSKIALIQMSRLNNDELSQLSTLLESFEIEPNTDALLSPAPSITLGDRKLEDISYQPIYSFSENSIDHSLLINGEMPPTDNSFEVVINKTGYEYLKGKINGDVIGVSLFVHTDFESHYYTNEVSKPVITDYFIYDKNVTIVGVVDDFGFLATPTIYYSFISFKKILQDSLLVNLSKYLKKSVYWYDYINECPNNDPLSSYSHRLFLKDINNKSQIDELINQIPEPYVMESTPIMVSDSLNELMTAATMGMELFLVIALLGTALIMGIISFSSYSEDKKTSAILTCLGAKKGDIFSIYFYENLMLGSVALFISFVAAPILSFVINKVVYSLTGFNSIITIPFLRFLDRPLLFPIIIVLSTFLICVVATYIPLFFSKKISPREELAEE